MTAPFGAPMPAVQLPYLLFVQYPGSFVGRRGFRRGERREIIMSTHVDCAKTRELASEYLEGTLPAALMRGVQGHADSCSACASDLRALQSVWESLNSLPEVEPPLFFRENVMLAVQREKESRQPRGWRSLLPQLGRVAANTLLTGGAVAAIAWTLLVPTPDATGGTEVAGLPRPNGGLLPGVVAPREATTTQTNPQLQIRRTTTVDPEHGPSYEFALWLEGADRGTVRVHLLPDDAVNGEAPAAARFTLAQGAPQALRVPLGAVQGETINLYVFWTAGGQSHSKRLFVPVPKDDSLPASQQSFGLRESRLAEAAREVAARFGQPVTIEDVPNLDKVTVTARQETATQALRRALSGRGVRISYSAAGILVAPDASAPSGQ